MKRSLTIFLVIFFLAAPFGCARPLTTREKATAVGAVGGAAAGGIIGAAVRHPAAGALIGGALGAGAGLLIGDQMQNNEQKQQQQQRQIDKNAAEAERLKKEQERLKNADREY
ncbi:MAG TPA: glycine zipper domain-containing protein [Candidatus Binatia bacterium]|jgi:outer membrane lipoprotein SlyB